MKFTEAEKQKIIKSLGGDFLASQKVSLENLKYITISDEVQVLLSESIQRLKEHPKDIDALETKGGCLGYFERYEEALECYESVVSLIGHNEPLLKLKGKCYYNLGKFEKAKEYFYKAVKINRSSHDNWYLLSLVCEQLKQMNLANKALDNAINLKLGFKPIDPDNKSEVVKPNSPQLTLF